MIGFIITSCLCVASVYTRGELFDTSSGFKAGPIINNIFAIIFWRDACIKYPPFLRRENWSFPIFIAPGLRTYLFISLYIFIAHFFCLLFVSRDFYADYQKATKFYHFYKYARYKKKIMYLHNLQIYVLQVFLVNVFGFWSVRRTDWR